MKNCLIMLVMVFLPLEAILSQNCPPGATTSQRDNKLFLYFPTTADNSFPEYNSQATTSPLASFDVSDLDSGIGTTAQLRNRIFEIVTEDYCEFNVEVIQTTTSPNTSSIPRWQVVGIGSDDETIFGGNLFGVAQDVDIDDADAQDYARVYAGSFGEAYGGTGGELNGSNSNLERWATAIGHTTSHEAGHNYGLGHGDSAPRTGEDGQNNHILATGSTGLTGEVRASRRRHFSDQSYEILAHNIGLNVKTLYNWDFVNPNSSDAHSMEITLLSSASSLTISWWYNGSRSPWRDPTITATGSNRSFQGTSYNEFILTFSLDKNWSSGSPGIAPPGVEFHTGASFVESDPVIVYDTKLQNSSGTDLPLHPRMIGFDAGALDLSTGDLDLTLFNPNEEEGDLIVENLTIQLLPRLVDIEIMLDDQPLQGIRGLPVNNYSRCTPLTRFRLSDNRKFSIANLNDKRFVDLTYDPSDCEEGIIQSSNDGEGIEVKYCPKGTALSLFPSTSVYVTATIIDTEAQYFDPDEGAIVTGPLASKVFYQFIGIVPDLNENGVDDLIDIRYGTSSDENSNGVVDEVDPNIQGHPDNDGFKLPFGLGITTPLESFDDDFSQGFYVELKFNNSLIDFMPAEADRKLRLSLNSEAGIYTFENLEERPYNIWGIAAGARVDYDLITLSSSRKRFLSLYIDANAGGYKATELDWQFGWNYGGGLSADLGRVFIDAGYSRFTLEENIDFSTLGLSVGLNIN